MNCFVHSVDGRRWEYHFYRAQIRVWNIMRLEGRFLTTAEVLYFDFALSLVLIDVPLQCIGSLKIPFGLMSECFDGE